jgi:hypothetical protein
MCSLRYELGFCMPEDGILHSHRRENLRSYMLKLTLEDETNSSVSSERRVTRKQCQNLLHFQRLYSKLL